MGENDKIPTDISEHIKAITSWASEKSDKRFAFIVCGEYDSQSIATQSGLVGYTSKIANALRGLSEKEEAFKDVLTLTVSAINGTVAAMFLKHKALKEFMDGNSKKNKSGFKDVLPGLLKTIADNLKYNNK